MSQTSPDAKAVVRAAEARTTQVRRIADALTTPVVEQADAATTTPPTVRRWDGERGPGWNWIDGNGTGEMIGLAATVERPWWETVAEVRAELKQAQAAIERVQQACHGLPYEHARRILAALDGTEQPTT